MNVVVAIVVVVVVVVAIDFCIGIGNPFGLLLLSHVLFIFLQSSSNALVSLQKAVE